MASVIRKCQSKKHLTGGCGDPQCPEGLSIQVALQDALKNDDIVAYLEARGKVKEKPEWVKKVDGYVEIDFGAAKYGKHVVALVEPNRPDFKKAVAGLDKTKILSFANVKRIEAYFNERYAGAVTVKLAVKKDANSGWAELHVVNLNVDSDLRGLGVGTEIRKTLIRHADESGYILGGSPTTGGDGSKLRTGAYDPEWETFAEKHRQRLVGFYLKHGYILNPTDYDAPKDNPIRLTANGKAFLTTIEAKYIKLPNNEYPAGMCY